MFTINDDMSIYLTRGDTVAFQVTAAAENGENYVFQPGEVVRIKVTEKKDCEVVALEKDFPITEETEEVIILLTEEETKIGDVISKPTDYWYEIELNPYTKPQTIIGYDEDGAKILKLFPEGNTVESEPIDPEDIPVVDDELSMSSERPVKNHIITGAMLNLRGEIDTLNARFNKMSTLKEGSTTGDAELEDIRVAANGTIYGSAGDSVREQFRELTETVTGMSGELTQHVESLNAELRTSVEEATTTANALSAELKEKLSRGAFIGPQGQRGETGPQGEQGEKGEKGDPGDKGERGDSGVCVPVSGYFTLSGDAEGNLWVHYPDGDNPPQFETDKEGNIFLITPDE